MNYLTNYYKNVCEQLQERINNMTKLINEAKDESTRQLSVSNWEKHGYLPSRLTGVLHGKNFPNAKTDSEVGEEMMKLSPEQYHTKSSGKKGHDFVTYRETPEQWNNRSTAERQNIDFGEQDLDLELNKDWRFEYQSYTQPSEWTALIDRPQQEMLHAIGLSKAAEGRANARQMQMTPAQRELEQAAINPSGAKTPVPWSGQVKQKIDALKQKGN